MDRNKLEQVIELHFSRDIKYTKKSWDKLSLNERIDGSLYFRARREKTCEICLKKVKGQIFDIAILKECIQRRCNICGFITKLPTNKNSC